MVSPVTVKGLADVSVEIDEAPLLTTDGFVFTITSPRHPAWNPSPGL